MKVPKAGFFLCAAPLALVMGLGSLAIPTQEVRWQSFVGNIRTGAAGTVGSGTGAVQAAGAPWVTTGGNARVDLASGELRFGSKVWFSRTLSSSELPDLTPT